MIFGWSQILIDLQPLIVMLSGKGHLHGFTHTFVGATAIALAAALTGKYLAPIGLSILHIGNELTKYISWKVAFVSAFIGTYSHVALDSIMHADLQPFAPLTNVNPMLGLIPLSHLYDLCAYSGAVGALAYFVTNFFVARKKA